MIISELKNFTNETQCDESTSLFGEDGILDSMGLVNLVVNLEERIHEEYNIFVTLADERAMSRTESPFRSIRTLAAYIDELIKEVGGNV